MGGVPCRSRHRRGVQSVSDLVPVTIEEQIAEVEREIGFRAKSFPRHVAQGKLTQAAADEHRDRMMAVLYTLRRVRDGVAEAVPGVEEIRRGAMRQVLDEVLPHVHSSKMVAIERKLGLL